MKVTVTETWPRECWDETTSILWVTAWEPVIAGTITHSISRTESPLRAKGAIRLKVECSEPGSFLDLLVTIWSEGLRNSQYHCTLLHILVEHQELLSAPGAEVMNFFFKRHPQDGLSNRLFCPLLGRWVEGSVALQKVSGHNQIHLKLSLMPGEGEIRAGDVPIDTDSSAGPGLQITRNAQVGGYDEQAAEKMVFPEVKSQSNVEAKRDNSSWLLRRMLLKQRR
jgi:hypothetical protein